MAIADVLTPPSIPADFGISEEHALAQKAARRFFTERCPASEMRRIAAGPLGFDPDLWKELAHLGWIGLVSAEEHGGAALDHLHLALLLEEMGRCLLPSHYLGCVLALAAIEHAAGAAQKNRWCPPIIAGERIATLALSEPNGSWEPSHVETTADPISGGFILRGTKTHVLSGASAQSVVVPCREPDGGIGLYVVDVPAPGVSVESEVPVDTTRRTARITLDAVRVAPDARLEACGVDALSAVFVKGYALLAAEMCGAAEAVLLRTRDYACERQQFGRPIGAFQAVKHPIVDMMIGIEKLRSLVYGSAALLARARPDAAAEVTCRMAKSLAGDVFSYAVRKGVQLHGGYGFTWDCDIHYYFKRALWSRGTLGDGTHHRRLLAAKLFGAGCAEPDGGP